VHTFLLATHHILQCMPCMTLELSARTVLGAGANACRAAQLVSQHDQLHSACQDMKTCTSSPGWLLRPSDSDAHESNPAVIWGMLALTATAVHNSCPAGGEGSPHQQDTHPPEYEASQGRSGSSGTAAPSTSAKGTWFLHPCMSCLILCCVGQSKTGFRVRVASDVLKRPELS
jgi:hypothetical protein